MVNGIFPSLIQATTQITALPPIVPMFESGTVWLNDEIRLLVLGY